MNNRLDYTYERKEEAYDKLPPFLTPEEARLLAFCERLFPSF